MFASSSRLDLYFVLGSNQEGDMKTIMSRHSPPLPIEINYNRWVESLTTKEMGRILAALKCPDRILGFTLTGSADDLNKIFKATARRPFPALESLALRDGKRKKLKIPATFLKESDLHLRTLKLQHVSLPSISRFLSSAPALTDLSLVLDTDVGPPLAMSLLLSYLQGMHYLRRLELDTTSEIDGLVRPTKPEERFPLAKLTFFHYRGHSAFLNTLVAGIVAPAVREIDIDLYDIRALPPITDLPRFIDDIGERYHAVQVSIDRDCFHFSLFTQSEYVGRHSPHLKLCTDRFFESVMHTSNAFSAKLTTAEELILIFVPMANIPWHSFLQHFPSVKALRMPGSYNPHISSVLHQDYEGLNLAFLPALEEIEIFQSPFCYHESERVAELAAFEPFVSARQQAGFQVKVVNSNRAFNDVCR
jgi:hypothetical protein